MKRSRYTNRDAQKRVQDDSALMSYMEFETWTVQDAVKRGHRQVDVLNRTMALALHDWEGLDALRVELGLKPRYQWDQVTPESTTRDQAPADSDA